MHHRHSNPQVPTAVGMAAAELPSASAQPSAMARSTQELEERPAVVKKKRAFVMQAPTPAKTTRRTVKAADLVYGTPGPLPPPAEVLNILGCQTLFLGIDTETHQLVPRNRSRTDIGRFGLWTSDLGDVCSQLRLVQVGWCKGELHWEKPKTTARLVKPEGFVIDADATAKHRISNELAQAEGAPITGVLEEFLAAALEVDRLGGRVVAHNLAFDSEMISEELKRSNLLEEAATWEGIASRGLCTMAPHIGHWIRKMAGMGDVPMNVRINLKDAARVLLPNCAELCVNHHHAGNDAEMHWYVCRELKRLAGRAAAQT